jgi:hypothetical protein
MSKFKFKDAMQKFNFLFIQVKQLVARVDLLDTDAASDVNSVFTRSGNVVAQAGDYTAAQVTNAFDKTVDDSDDITEGATNLLLTVAERAVLTGLSTGYTVATLPGAPTAGDRTHVTDGSVVAAGNFGTTVAGGGANIVPVFYDGTNWIIA